MPVTFIEGIRADRSSDIERRDIERRFYALAAAVRDHQARVRRSNAHAAPADENLYRTLRQISGETATGEHGVA